MTIKHFKLANSEEIICEVVQWDNDSCRDLIIRKALKVDFRYAEDTNHKYFTFTPWMSLQDDIESLQYLNGDHVLAMSEPSETSLEYYSEVMREVDDMQSNDIDLAEFGVSDSADADQIMVH